MHGCQGAGCTARHTHLSPFCTCQIRDVTLEICLQGNGEAARCALGAASFAGLTHTEWTAGDMLLSIALKRSPEVAQTSPWSRVGVAKPMAPVP